MWLHILISDNNLTAQTSKVDLDKIDTNTSLFRYASFTNEM